MKNYIDLRRNSSKNIYDLGSDFSMNTDSGKSVSFTNFYMKIDDKPYYGVSGEFHYARCSHDIWEDELIKMKNGGINIVSTYMFWIHHEEEEGVFDFSGNRDVRKFVDLCHKHGLLVIIRIGPFDHGEVRNGGLPDWLYGKAFDSRTTDPGFLKYVERLYLKIHQQLDGTYFGQGGPIIAAQIDNEYMHSSAAWEITTGISDEWIATGDEGDDYMLALLDIAKRVGIVVPFYTCTAWGGAATPTEMMPLWGGYAFRPWIFYTYQGEHPATEEYIYRDNHNNEVLSTYNFEPFYEPESKPYLCCEMGGGMTCCYYYRFELPFESVDAMANIKLGSGCNMLGYYMYHGGTNPTGSKTPFLNEAQVPKLSYDYQAALGEFGQVRPSYHRLRMLHYLVQNFSDILCEAKTYLPDNSQEIEPKDKEILRYALRLNSDNSGFVFINNYQDHAEMADKRNQSIELDMRDRRIVIDRINLAAGENCVLPINIRLGAFALKYSLTQPIVVFDQIDSDTQKIEKYAFFFTPEGMSAEYCFDLDSSVTISGNAAWKSEACDILEAGINDIFRITDNSGNSLNIVTLDRANSLRFYCLDTNNGPAAILTDATILYSKPKITSEYTAVATDEMCTEDLRFQHNRDELNLQFFPRNHFADRLGKPIATNGIWGKYDIKIQNSQNMSIKINKTGKSRYVIELGSFPTSLANVILKLKYIGDIGQAFINGKMISDNFANGAVWEIGLKEFMEQIKNDPLTIYIAPVREGRNVNVESVMAGRKEETSSEIAELISAELEYIYQWEL